MRWLHIYVSMFGLAAVLFFSVTGITLNHPDWFFGETERSVQAEGEVDPKWLHLDEPGRRRPTSPPDPSREVAKLEVVEHLRQGPRDPRRTGRVPGRRGRVPRSTFKGPGYAADAFIDRETGHYNLTQTYHGFVAVINDLHKGRDTGPAWSVLIDVSAVLLTLISLTGLVLLFYLKLRRVPGLIVAIVGTIFVLALYLWGVP